PVPTPSWSRNVRAYELEVTLVGVTPRIWRRLQVAAANTAELVRGEDGLMYAAADAAPPPPAAGKVLTSGALEGSNVDATSMLVSMIQLSRQFEMQVRILQKGDENARAANTLLSSR
ncbi:MAG: hypothetical protein KY442_06025, partial [Proteobacteria bacterium]|nr:hypothetical protein [Pseudomonadota bacterium]